MDIDKSILIHTKKRKWTVHGCRATNFWLPQNLQRPTQDWDLWSKNPAKAMDVLEDELDKEAGGDYFYEQTVPLIGSATGEKVYRVVSRLTGKEVADFMKLPKEKNLYKVVSGIRWETLNHAKKTYIKILQDPSLHHRWSKARTDLNRILAFERSLGKKEQVQINKLPDAFRFAPIKFAQVHFVRPLGW